MTVEPVDAPSAVMWTVKQIADRDGISKQAVSKRIKLFADKHQLTVSRDGQGRVAAVNVAEFDHLRERYGDPSKAQAPTLPIDQAPQQASAPTAGRDKSADSLEEAKRQQAWIDAERSRMRFAEEKKELLRVTSVIDAVSDCGIEITRIVDRLPISADDLAAAIGRDGTHGLRVELKKLAQHMRDQIATALAKVAATAPEFEQVQSNGETEEAPAMALHG